MWGATQGVHALSKNTRGLQFDKGRSNVLSGTTNHLA